MELLDRATTERAEGAVGSSASAPHHRPSLQERVEASRTGRWVISALLVVTLAAVPIWNMPESELRETVHPVVEPYVNATGLDQVWNLFAPNPPRRTFEIVARIEYADGSLALWRPPRNDRWRKWLGTIRFGSNQRLWEPTASWIARHHDDGGRRTVQVKLIQRHRDLPPPGSGVGQMAWVETPFFTYDVPEGGGG